MNAKNHSIEIQDLMNQSDLATSFLESLADRTKDMRITTVDQVVRRFRASRSDVVELFKQMQEIGLGDFVVGRRQSPSRFVWHARMTEVGQVATGELDSVTLVEPEELDDSDEEKLSIEEDDDFLDCYEHPFKLRKGFEPIVLSLPKDLTQAEAERIAAFVKSLPLE
ncbi:hypothetical protein [Burkholderia cepacia]|uniref:hypothetical protein n=1 Tax=Burkholderia cepacia TaxID=292 RepID=UPI0015920FEF|nr:hypothetical protein [Burkholderia cepacia]